MFCLQASIGSANDVVDAAADRLAKPAKPIPAGLVERRTAGVVAVVAGLAGLALAGLFGPAVLLVAVLGYGLGLAYDLRLKRTSWSWLAYALALPLVPAFAWLGAGAGLPPRFPVLAAMALVAGTALAVANGLVDLEGDAATGTAGLAGALGRRRALGVVAVCDAAVVVLAAVTAWAPRSQALAPVARHVARRRALCGRGLGCRRAAWTGGGGWGGSCRPARSRSSRSAGSPCSSEPKRALCGRAPGGGQLLGSPARTTAIAFSSRSFTIVRYLARLARSTPPISPSALGSSRTWTSSSSASAK